MRVGCLFPTSGAIAGRRSLDVSGKLRGEWSGTVYAAFPFRTGDIGDKRYHFGGRPYRPFRPADFRPKRVNES